MALDMDALKNLFRTLIPRVRWAEEQELVDSLASVDTLDTTDEPAAESTPESNKTEPGAKNADGSPFSGLNLGQ